MPKDCDLIPSALGAADVAQTPSALGFELLDADAGDEAAQGALAYRIGYESSPSGVDGVMERLRVSEVYRRDGTGWMRIHRHVSPAHA
ncbi:hypothetical protein FHY55_20195 [Oceanicola sp. D3]|uniref:hypothetical protein n=1 Tax=Oceanicola sp. D3 TaxID=2587163 RepID=UPI001120D0E2|nr:hypothetical protein [Oceanicola sp. D3]QDC11408.1 hypothetical protein FHY55_20195 [Oceanicola sp. D3]